MSPDLSCFCEIETDSRLGETDTALTRMYNQSPNSIGPDGKPRGLLCESNPRTGTSSPPTDSFLDLAGADKNPIDCLYKTWKVEGVRGLYKGSIAHLARIAPHTVSSHSHLVITRSLLIRRLLSRARQGCHARDERVYQSTMDSEESCETLGREGLRVAVSGLALCVSCDTYSQLATETRNRSLCSTVKQNSFESKGGIIYTREGRVPLRASERENLAVQTGREEVEDHRRARPRASAAR